MSIVEYILIGILATVLGIVIVKDIRMSLWSMMGTKHSQSI